MLALGIVASLAVNVAQGWSHGLVGAVVAAWPAVSLVGRMSCSPGSSVPQQQAARTTYQQRTTTARSRTSQGPARGPQLARHPMPDQGAGQQVIGPAPAGGDGPQVLVPAAGADQRPGPGLNVSDHADQMRTSTRFLGYPSKVSTASESRDIDAAAVAAYRASVQSGQPISERKLAEMFGTTSRRWARNRMAEAQGIRYRPRERTRVASKAEPLLLESAAGASCLRTIRISLLVRATTETFGEARLTSPVSTSHRWL